MNTSGLDPKGSHAEVLTGTKAILDRLPALHAVAERWGQAAELAELPYLLSVPIVPRREPLLVVLHASATQSVAADVDPLGAVLVFAYSAGIFGQRLFSHPDHTGRRCVFCPASDRTAIAVRVARILSDRGSALIHIPYRLENQDSERKDELSTTFRRQNALCALGMMELGSSVDWTLHSVNRPLELPLAPTLDTTLERIGKRTRRNLRAAMRRCEREQACQLEWNPSVSAEEMKRFNVSSTHRVRQGVVQWRYDVWQREPQSFLAGLRNGEGEWLALAGGRRTGDGVTLDWQMNKKFPRFSVSLVMRGLLMAFFGAEGLTRMRFEGGTTHALARGFHRGPVYTLRVRRKSLWLQWLERALLTFFPSRAITHDLFSSHTQADPLLNPVDGREHEGTHA